MYAVWSTEYSSGKTIVSGPVDTVGSGNKAEHLLCCSFMTWDLRVVEAAVSITHHSNPGLQHHRALTLHSYEITLLRIWTFLGCVLEATASAIHRSHVNKYGEKTIPQLEKCAKLMHQSWGTTFGDFEGAHIYICGIQFSKIEMISIVKASFNHFLQTL